MFKETLEELGLSSTEARIYEALINIGKASVPDISLKINVHRRNIYDTMPKLLKKGLVYQIAESKENLYAAVEPAKLQDLIKEKESKLKTILPNLNKQFRKTASTEAVYVYKGIEGWKNYLRDILKVGEDVYFIGAKGGWFDPEMQPFIKQFNKKALAKNINYRHIFDWEMKTKAPEVLTITGKSYKFLPKKYSTTGIIDIFGDRVVTLTGMGIKKITEDISIIVMINQELADCYRTWFQFIWDFCPKAD